MRHPPFHCPVCRTHLLQHNALLRCPSCNATYQCHGSIPILLADRLLNDFKREEQHFHDDLAQTAQTANVQKRNSEFHWHFKKPMLKLPQENTILEVACGTRADGIELALARHAVTSLDISLDAVGHARHLAEKNGAGESIRFVVGDGEHLPFNDRCFDATFTAASFHHFPDQHRALQEMKRVTKPGGYVIWGVEPAQWPYKTMYKLLAPVKNSIRHRRHRTHNSIADDSTEGYTEQQIRQLFHSVGLNIIDIRRVKFLSEFYDSAIRLLGRLLQKNIQSSTAIDHVLARIDAVIGRIPKVDRAFWHYNIISVVPNNRS